MAKYMNKNIVMEMSKDFRISEAFKSLRMSLVLNAENQECQTIVVTGVSPSDGKSTIAANLAASLAELDLDVLLIDADLRKPTVHKKLNLSLYPGLTNVIGKMCEIEKAIQSTAWKSLSVLTAGAVVINPTEALASLSMSNLLTDLKQMFDYIIIDTPPLVIMSDALALVKQSSGAILVVRENCTKHMDIRKVIQKIEFIDGKILGFVLNSSTESDSGGSYYYYYYDNKSKK